MCVLISESVRLSEALPLLVAGYDKWRKPRAGNCVFLFCRLRFCFTSGSIQLQIVSLFFCIRISIMVGFLSCDLGIELGIFRVELRSIKN